MSEAASVFETFEHVRATLEGGVLTLCIDRPKARNAMSLQTVSELEAAFAAVAERRDGAVRPARSAVPAVKTDTCAGYVSGPATRCAQHR